MAFSTISEEDRTSQVDHAEALGLPRLPLLGRLYCPLFLYSQLGFRRSGEQMSHEAEPGSVLPPFLPLAFCRL